MTAQSPRHVVDTNVAVTANGTHNGGSDACVAACGRALANVMKGHVFIDAEGEIVEEYRRNLSASSQPSPGTQFLKWLLTNEYSVARVTRVPITKCETAPNYNELSPPPPGVNYDPSDCKFLAVAAAHPDKPTILQATDSKWVGWVEALRLDGVTIDFVCEQEIRARHAKKTNKRTRR